MRKLIGGSLVLSLAVSGCSETTQGPASASATAEQQLASAPHASPPVAAANSVSAVAVAPSAVASAVAADALVIGGIEVDKRNSELAAQIKHVETACSWDGKAYKADCKGMTEWVNFLFEPVNDYQAVLMALLDSKDPKVVFLAGRGLEVDGVTGTRDPALAKSLFGALERQTNALVCVGIAMQAAQTPSAEVGQEEAAKRVFQSHPTLECRAAFIQGVLYRNPQFYDDVVAVAEGDGAPELRDAATQGLTAGTRENVQRQQRNCKVWGGLLSDSNDAYVARAARLLGEQGRGTLTKPCVEQWPVLLTKAQARATAGQIGSSGWVAGVCGVVEQRQVEDEQRSKALAVLRKIVEVRGNDETSRAGALACAARSDAEAKTWAKPFESDSSVKVQAVAKRVHGTEK